MAKTKKEKEAAARRAANQRKRRKTAKNIARIGLGAASAVQVGTRVTIPEHLVDFFHEIDPYDTIAEQINPNRGQRRGGALFLRDLLSGDADVSSIGMNLSHAASMADPLDSVILTSPSWGFELLPLVPFLGGDAQRLIEEIAYEYSPQEVKRAARRAAS